MPTQFVKGDLFATEGLHSFAHGCNCVGAMDSGIAAAFKKRWPRMFEEYRLRCEDGRFRLGDVFVWSEGDVVVYNLAIQEHWKKRPKLAALTRALEKMIELASHAGVERIGLPRIGTGVGGLDWARVRKVLTETGEGTTISLEVFDKFVRAKGAETAQEPPAPPGESP
jgi:O-acetyl-ADP-ribose deacetylase (regulator of RNase III)